MDGYKKKSVEHRRNPDSLAHYARLLLAIKDSSAISLSYNKLAHSMKMRNVQDSSIYYFQKSYDFTPSGNIDQQKSTTSSLAMQFNAVQQFEKALDLEKEMLEIAAITGDVNYKAYILTIISSSLEGLHRYEQSIASLLESAALQEKVDPFMLPNTYLQIATNYTHLGKEQLAFSWIHRALNASENSPNPRFKINALNALAKHHSTFKVLDSSKYYYSKIGDLAGFNDPITKQQTFLNLARINLKEENTEEATANFNKAKEIKIPIHVRNEEIAFWGVESRIESQKGNYERAIILTDSIIEFTRNGKINSRNYIFLLDKAKDLEALGKYKEALSVFNTYTKVKDSLAALNDLAIVQDSANQFEIDQKEEALQKAFADSKQSQIWNYVLLGLALITFLALAYYLSRYLKAKQSHKELQEMHADTLVAFAKLQQQLAQSKKPEIPVSILVNSKQVIKLDQLEYVKSEGHYLDYFIEDEKLPVTERNTIKNRITELEISGFLQVHRSFVINIDKVKSIQSGLVVMHKGDKIPLSRTFKQRLKEEQHPLFA